LISKHNIKRVIHHAKAGNYFFIYKKLKQKLKEKKVKNQKISKIDSKEDKGYFNRQFSSLHTKEDYVDFQTHQKLNSDLRCIAFYLPQFHPIAENDEWWGKGFTEWTNVSRAIPQFEGHYQPHLPGELGFYDLRLNDIQKRQIELAKNYGISGFCFHFYWFNGRRVLEKPLEQYLEDKSLDFPFCVNWANENWTRRWDGHDDDVLLNQDYSAEDDIDFIKECSKLFKDSRYIRVDGKPLLLIYRPSLFPNIKESVKRWREWCRENGIGEIYLVLTHSFEHINPEEIDFDAAVEFAPNSFPVKPINDNLKFDNKDYNGIVFDYKDAVKIGKDFIKPKYKKFRSACPGWDNEARKPGKGATFHYANPSLFAEWLTDLCKYTVKNFEPEEQLVFVNAWNEWAEGAHLEPDKKFGYGYLESSYDALKSVEKNKKKIIYVSHDAHFHGAQVLSLNIIRFLSEHFGLEVHMILKSGGELEKKFEKYATVYNFDKDYRTKQSQEVLIKQLKSSGISHAICNTVVSGDVLELLSDAGMKTIALIHELPKLIKDYNMQGNANVITKKANHVIFPSNYVKDKFETVSRLDKEKTVVSPQGLYLKNSYMNNIDVAREVLREKYNLSFDCKIVLAVGYGDYRKGIDLFLDVSKKLQKIQSNIYFIWVGNIAVDMQNEVENLKQESTNTIFVPSVDELSMYYAGADLYLMTSREDPFPSVVLEAMNVGVPVVGFENAGGFKDIVTSDTGILVPYLDTKEMTEAILNIFNDEEYRKKLSFNCTTLIHNDFKFKDYIYELLSLLGFDYKKVSVVVPNYNYEKYIKSRLESIINQTYPIYEIIFLDDKSSDNSYKVAKEYLGDFNFKDISLIKNETNSGSVFKQWSKGITISNGDYIWIAEADDLANREFLQNVMSGFENEDVVLSYSQSKQMCERGSILNESYLDYTNDIDNKRWLKNYIRNGHDELADTLSIKNTLPNVSAVVMKKMDIEEVLEKLLSFKVAGDWYFYAWILQKGKISYCHKSLNMHRRHTSSVTSELDSQKHFDEIVQMQNYIKEIVSVKEDTQEKIILYRENVKTYLNLI